MSTHRVLSGRQKLELVAAAIATIAVTPLLAAQVLVGLLTMLYGPAHGYQLLLVG